MLQFREDFFRDIFHSIDNNAVLMRVEEDGRYFPVWCSPEFCEMMQGSEAEFIAAESGGTMHTVHPDDREEVAFLFKNHHTRSGSNRLAFRKFTLQGELIWVTVHYAFVRDRDIQYAYCTYADITEAKTAEAQARVLYENLNEDLLSLAEESLAALRLNVSTGFIEQVRGRDLFPSDREGSTIARFIVDRLTAMPVASDRDAFRSGFVRASLLDRFARGEERFELPVFIRRPSGRQCFVNYTLSMRRHPVSGDVVALLVESEFNAEKVTQVLNEEILAQQYDMVTYLVSGYYGVVIGDAANIPKGSIFPRERSGLYADYLEQQVIPAVSGGPKAQAQVRRLLSQATVEQALAKNKPPYQIDIAIELDGETFYKRFSFYPVDGQSSFYILLKSDITQLVRQQQEINERQQREAVFTGMIEQFNAIADESLAVLRYNFTSGLVEEVRGMDLYQEDTVGASVSSSLSRRAENFVVEGDRERYLALFDAGSLSALADQGSAPRHFTGYCIRRSGRQGFVRFSVTASKNPLSGDLIAFVVEQDYSDRLIADVLDEKVLAQQYDMITYIVRGYYGVAIGDAGKAGRGSIFPRQPTGVYETYLQQQVFPVAVGSQEEKAALMDALSFPRVLRELGDKDCYVVDVNIDVSGEIFHKRFSFYSVDLGSQFVLLLKADVTEFVREQSNRTQLLTAALAEAEQASLAKTSFLSSMSHEIRTPMNAIIGLSSIALREQDLLPGTRQYLEKIGASAKHLLGLINDILDMSRIESGKVTLKTVEFSFSDVIDQINSMVHSQCEDKGLEYSCEMVGLVDDYYIGDEMKLKQVLLNILSNAVKFTPAPGKVTFRVENAASFGGNTTLRFIVKDTGIGMDPSFVPRIFDAFSQEDGSNTTRYGSTGLGMALTKNMVQIMNGKIEVQSQKNVGSTFTVTLTLKQADRSTIAKKDQTFPQQMRLLVVDDDEVACAHAKLVLEEVGIQADTAMSSQEALHKIEMHHARMERYDLILCDLKMPVMDGIELTRTIRELYGEDSTIIILTAYNWDDIIDDAVSAGVDSFLPKPLFVSTILDQLSRVLTQRQEKQSAQPPHRAELAGRRVLVAEDMLINAEIIMELLSIWDMEADHAENGQQAVDLFAASAPGIYSCVLMDIRMPVLDGLGAAEGIRTLDRPDAKTVPIIALTANAFDEDVERSLQAGMNAHLTKPIDPDLLQETMETLIPD